MDLTRQKDHYAIRLADDLLNCCEKKTADFLNMVQYPYYTQDMFTNRVLPDVGQLKTLLDNASRGSQFINFAPTFMIQDSKKDWQKNIKKEPRETGSIVYKGKDENGNKHYEMMTPAGKFNPGIEESPMTQSPVPNVGIYRQTPTLDPRDPKGIEKYLTNVIGNYFNAAFTKTPYFPPEWGKQETEMLSKALNVDPALVIRTSQQAFAQANSVKMENTVNQELNDNVREAMKQGLPPFNTKKQDEVIGPVNVPANGVQVNGVPANGVDFINSYYKSINGKGGAEQTNTTVTQNGYIPYQTHEENPKNIDRFLVEEYGNIMNASLTGTPYSGSVTPAQLKNLSSGIESKMANDPAYMSGIVNQAHQNVLGYNYMPYDKDDFITRAQDPSSREYKMLNDAIERHLNDMVKNKKMSFNGEFQKLSGDLAEKMRNTQAAKTERKPSTRTSAGKTAAAKTTAQKTSAQKTSAPKTAAPKTSAGKAAGGGTSAAKNNANSSVGAAAAGQPAVNAQKTERRPPTRTSGGRAAAGRTSAPGNEEKPRAAANTEKKEERPAIVAQPENRGQRPSFLREVTEFVNKNLVERKPALVLVDTFLGSIIDKTRKIVRTGKTIATAFVIASSIMAPNLQMPIASHLAKMHVPNAVSISVNQNDFKSAARGAAVKTMEHVRQAAHHVKTAARR